MWKILNLHELGMKKSTSLENIQLNLTVINKPSAANSVMPADGIFFALHQAAFEPYDNTQPYAFMDDTTLFLRPGNVYKLKVRLAKFKSISTRDRKCSKRGAESASSWQVR